MIRAEWFIHLMPQEKIQFRRNFQELKVKTDYLLGKHQTIVFCLSARFRSRVILDLRSSLEMKMIN